MAYTTEWGSRTAKVGFRMEKFVAKLFNDWRKSRKAKAWLREMRHEPEKIDRVSAEARGVGKMDVKATVKPKKGGAKVEKISVKSVKMGAANYNQVDKRRVNDYVSLFDLSEGARIALKKFAGEKGFTPPELRKRGELKGPLRRLYNAGYAKRKGVPPRRLSFRELSDEEQCTLLRELEQKKCRIVATVLSGEPQEVSWFMAIRYEEKAGRTLQVVDHLFEPIEKTIERNCYGRVGPSNSSIRVGQLILQRKGGTPDPEKLQFKMRPWPISERRSTIQPRGTRRRTGRRSNA